MASTKPARGIRDFLPADVRKREYVIGTIKKVYASYGFEPLDGIDSTFGKNIDGDSISVEAKAILAINEALSQLRIKNFAIYVSHSDVLTCILETVGVPEKLHKHTFATIRNFNKYDIEGFVNELQAIGVSEKASAILADLFLKTDEILNQEHDINRTVVSNLLNIVNSDTLTEIGQILRLTGRTPVLIDPALACESPYSSGIVIEARTSGLDVLGIGGCIGGKTVESIDEESAVFMFSFDIEIIVALMENSNAFPPPMDMTV
ncbi:MAG: ATP phosphoribosyltransferase regulatory subunit [Acidobacteriota bacterium]